jgi:hypothetical protein
MFWRVQEFLSEAYLGDLDRSQADTKEVAAFPSRAALFSHPWNDLFDAGDWGMP